MHRNEKVVSLLTEAHAAYAEAMEVLEEADKLWDREMLRKSAKMTWDAALKATNALIMARTGEEATPDDDRWTYDCLMRLVWENREKNQDLKPIKGQYAIISADVYEAAVVERNVEPVYLLIHDIRQTADYIRDCERLAWSS